MATTRTTPWYLEIVHVSSREKQQDLLTLLHEVASVTALGSSSGPDHYVVFECPDRRLKTSIEKLFGEVDPASVLTETHHQPLAWHPEEDLMTNTPPEPPDIGPEGPVPEDDPPTEPDGAPEKGPSPQWA